MNMKPKKGDRVTIRNSGFGCISYEEGEIDRISGGRVFLVDLNHPFDIRTGEYLLPQDWPRMGLCITVVFDGGASAREETRPQKEMRKSKIKL